MSLACERLGQGEIAARELHLARQLYPTSAEDLYWLGYIAFYLEHDPKAADAFWANCLLVEPESHSGRVESRTKESPAYNLHILARIQRALCTNYDDKDVKSELSLAAQLSPRFAEECNIWELARALKSSAPMNSGD